MGGYGIHKALKGIVSTACLALPAYRCASQLQTKNCKHGTWQSSTAMQCNGLPVSQMLLAGLLKCMSMIELQSIA
jgi:hypothetical protein